MTSARLRTELRTERLVLRPFLPDDVDDALEYRNDPEFVRYLPHIPLPYTRAHAEAFVAGNMSDDWATAPTFAVVLDGRLIGTTNLDVDAAARTAMLGYAIARAVWGRGIAVEAAGAVMAWAVPAFGLLRIWAATDVHNLRSQRVLEKLAMVREGVRLLDHPSREGRPIRELVYARSFADAP